MLHEVEVKIEGKPPGILFNNPENTMGAKPSLTRVYIPEEEAEKRCYWMDETKSSLSYPSTGLYRGLSIASKGIKIGKSYLEKYVLGDVTIFPEPFVPFNVKAYDIHKVRVVVVKQGIIRHRPWLKTWQLSFITRWEDIYLGKDFHKSFLPTLLEKWGSMLGMGDFRPEKKGPYGRFKVISISPSVDVKETV